MYSSTLSDHGDQHRDEQGACRPTTGGRQEDQHAHADGRQRPTLHDVGPGRPSAAAQSPSGRRLEARRQVRALERQEPPHQQVGDDPGPVEPRADDERDADRQLGNAQVLGDTRTHAGHQPTVGRSVRPSEFGHT